MLIPQPTMQRALAIVSPEIEPVPMDPTRKIALDSPPEIVSWLAPGPMMSTPVEIWGRGVATVIVLAAGRPKVIRSG